MAGNELKLSCRFAGDMTLVARSDSGHWTIMDVAESVGGNGGAMAPFEHLFAALAGCTGSDVLYVMRKKRIVIDDLRIEIVAHRVDTHPKIADKIHIHFIFVGVDIPAVAAEKAIELSQTKYCSVTAMIKATCEITTSFEILTPSEARAQFASKK